MSDEYDKGYEGGFADGYAFCVNQQEPKFDKLRADLAAAREQAGAVSDTLCLLRQTEDSLHKAEADLAVEKKWKFIADDERKRAIAAEADLAAARELLRQWREIATPGWSRGCGPLFARIDAALKGHDDE